jgi:hypothetical protein
MSKQKNGDEGEEEEDDNVKVHEIKFDEYGIMDDGLDESTNAQLKSLQGTYFFKKLVASKKYSKEA